MLCIRQWSNAESPKQGSKRFVQLYYEDDPICPSRYLFIYLGAKVIRAFPSASVCVGGASNTLQYFVYISISKYTTWGRIAGPTIRVAKV